MSFSVVMRRRSQPEVVDLAVALLRVDAAAWARVYLPWGCLSALCAAAAWRIEPLLALVVAALLGRLAQAPVTLAVSERVAGREPRVSPREALAAVGRLVTASILPTLGLALASLTIVGLPLLAIRFTHLPEVAIVERPPSDVLGRVGALANAAGARGWTTRAWLAGIEVWAMLVAEILGQFVVDGLLQLGTPYSSLMEGELTPFPILGLLLAQPLVALVRFCEWLDVRTRSEGLDAWFAVYAAAERGRPA